ncbi:heavy metal translocating P-type ATPase [Shuttleworthella satelles]|uniref:heavy metal translocating P-type ATPase n=1 Tax=Shuttleworthella satelles TaxID=177972 RepID=UPI0028D65338|nr:heavy metal translocating P-type ATPase [Shuttleworthia satelles]
MSKGKYAVTGMSCAACQARVEKAVNQLDHVDHAVVNLLTNSMTVEGEASEAEIVAAVERAGYGARRLSGGDTGAGSAGAAADQKGRTALESAMSQEEALLKDHETPRMIRRLVSSVGFLLALMYFSMGHMMFGWPLPPFFVGNHVAMALVQMLLAICVMIINRKFFVNGFRAVLHGGSNMDTLVAMGSAASFGWSLFATFMMTDAVVKNDSAAVMYWMNNLYFEGAAMILALITVGKTLESYSKGRTTDALKSLMKLAPKEATVVRTDANGREKETLVPVEQVAVGDIFLVRPGENVPVDGLVLEGTSAVDESALTGESIPVDKNAGDSISAATINKSGFLRAKATRVGADTSLSQIIQMVSDASASKAPIAKIADRVSGVFVPLVIAIAMVTLIVWFLVGADLGYALSRAIAVLVISCPCALGLATPVAIMVGNGKGARSGILFKNATSLEEAGRTQIVALDKTGTITQGSPQVTDLIPAEGAGEEELLTAALSLEAKSEHPLAKAVVDYGNKRHLTAQAAEDFEILPGNGLSARIAGEPVSGGSISYMSGQTEISDRISAEADALASMGKTPLAFAKKGKLLGLIGVADVIKEESPEAIAQLKRMGIRVVMLTGDNAKTAAAIAGQAGLDDVVAGVLPEGKEQAIRSLQTLGKVAMVGDGINDAPALTKADSGIAIGAGTDVAIDAADLVLMNSRLTDVPAAIRLSRATLRNIHENLFWAFFYNVIGIPLAAGCYVAAFGLTLNPMFGAAAMAFSSVFVVGNALRLNLFQVYNTKGDRAGRHEVSCRALHGVIADMLTPAGQKKTKEQAKKIAGGQNAGVQAEKSAEDQKTDASAGREESRAAGAAERKEAMMKQTVRIKGMMCGHCEATVKKALEALDGVESAEVSHEAGTAILEESKPVDEAAIKAAIEDRDYEFVSLEG